MKTTTFPAAFIVAQFKQRKDSKDYSYFVGEDMFVVSSDLFNMCKAGDISTIEFTQSTSKGDKYTYDGKEVERKVNGHHVSKLLDHLLDLSFEAKKKKLQKELAAL